jgi:hypothetical protein
MGASMAFVTPIFQKGEAMFSNVISKNDLWQLGKRILLTAVLLLALIAVGLIVSAVSGQRVAKNFEQAADFPRGAMVYAQFKDLPALLNQWNESELKDRYLNSVSFQQMQSRHLAIKLLLRWEEFNSAAGFSIDAAAFSSLADNRAAMAVYDIGKLDLLLIAPLSEAKFESCLFLQSKDNFEKVELPDGTTYYLRDVEADRGRQKQHIAFASIKGRFVLATNEALLLRAAANINGIGKGKDRLTDEPSFQELAKIVEPHFATVWVEQSKLNDDWYFKHYWLMSTVADLKNIRAGMFDLEMQQGRWVERREFLLNGKPNVGSNVPTQTVERLRQIVPADVPFVQVSAISGDQRSLAELVSGALFDGKVRAKDKDRSVNWQNYYDTDFDAASGEDGEYGESRYSYLDYKFDSAIDESADDNDVDDSELRLIGERRFAGKLQSALQASSPTAAARLARPKATEGLLFAEFARASVISLQNPASLDRASLESAIAELAGARLMIAGAVGKFEWKNRTEQGTSWREMELPMLGRSVGYGMRGNELIVSNNRHLLAELMSAKPAGQHQTAVASSPVSELTVIRLNQRKVAYDQIFARLEAPLVKAYWRQRTGEESSGPSHEFFTGEISSLLDVAAPVDEVRIQRNYSAGRLREEVSMIFNATVR